MAEKFTRWDASDHLKTEEDITAYFEACLDDDPGDGSLVRADRCLESVVSLRRVVAASYT